MNRQLQILVFFLICSFSLRAQPKNPTATIKGVVIDSASKKGQEYVTVALKQGNAALRTTLSGQDGSFLFNKVTPGKYTIVIAAMGFTPKNIPIEINKDQVLDLSSISILSQSNNLALVNITAAKPVIKQDIDRITYDIQADPESKVNTLLDMIRKVPLLAVDGDDNVTLKGNSNYKILINGKTSSMVAKNPSDIFKTMPASNIEKIEVITTPPSKYDSEGLGGIINIITKKNADNGYNGSLNYRQSAPVGGKSGSGSISVKEGKLGVSANFGLGDYKSSNTGIGKSRTTTGDSPTVLNQSGLNNYHGNFGYLSTELSYEIDTLNLLTADISYNRNDEKSFIPQTSTLFENSILTQSYDFLANEDEQWKGLDLGLNYQRNFKNHKDRIFTLSYKISNSTSSDAYDQEFQNRFNYDALTNPNYNQYNNAKSNEQTIQADYVEPLTKKLNLEGGVKAILRNNSSNFDYKNQTPTGEYVTDPALTNDFNNNQNVYGLYNSYQYNLKDWGFKAGARVEVTTITADFISQTTNLDKNYFNVIPALSINRKFKDMSSLNFGYTQRIQRPGIWQLNPFVDRSNPNFETSGNPDLVPVLNNSFEANYSRFKKGSINIGLNYSFANNTIQQISSYNAATTITSTTYTNTGHDSKLGTNFNISYPFTDALNLTMGGNMNYVWLEGMVDGVDFKNTGFQGYAYGSLTYKVKPDWRIGANLSYNSAYVSLQGQSKHNTFSSFSVAKDLIKDKLTLSGSFNNIFQKYMVRENETTGEGFTQSSYRQQYFRRFNASLNWKFGKLKDAVKKSQRGIKNDDSSGTTK
ncbi:TonB-dependent receptor domain-containing protein [Pedobacter sp. L105]|uniref:TonB-dependent receptor domain-containing protein n=1 Tax=Pedobacter sp. L105 TaxID=1641871 RepID=UPI00131AF11C|nr:TonB-dependent receptor [Pedobacter sp. L105]